MTSGYSKTPLAKKLGIKSGYTIWLLNAPNYYLNLFEDLPEDIDIIESTDNISVDFIHAFFTSENDLKTTIQNLKALLQINGLLWISWPKGKSKIETDLNRDLIRHIVLNAGLVDVKVAAIDEDWSGLKFVYRLKDRT